MLTPMDIHNKEFRRSFRGYNEEEIDDFLDQVVNDYEKLFRENDRLKEELARAQKDNEKFHEREQSISETLTFAQKTAEEMTNHTKATTAELKENTIKECENMLREAKIEAQRRLDVATSQVRAIVAEYDRLVREKNQFLRKVKVTMESELAVIDQTIAELPDPEAEEKAAAEKAAAREMARLQAEQEAGPDPEEMVEGTAEQERQESIEEQEKQEEAVPADEKQEG